MNNEILKAMRILPIEQIFPFELCSKIDDSNDFQEINHIRHPFLVSKISNEKYILLEQSEEFYTLKETGLTQIPVQIVAFEQLQITQDRIGLYSFNQDDLQEMLSEESNKFSLDNGKNSDQFDSITVEIDQMKHRLFFKFSNGNGCSDSISSFFKYIAQNGGYRMVRGEQSLSDSLMKIQPFNSTVSMMKINYQQLIDAVRTEQLFPPEIIHIDVDVRMLYVDFPISVLSADISINEKEEFLKELIMLREQAEKTSFYQGRIYLFNR